MAEEQPTRGSAQAPLAVSQPGDGGFWFCLLQASGALEVTEHRGAWLGEAGEPPGSVLGSAGTPHPLQSYKAPCDGDPVSPFKPTT